MKCAFLGATKGMGRSLSRLLAERGDSLFLLGRDPEELSRSAADLVARGAAGPVGTAPCDLLDPASMELALRAADEALGGFDTVVVTAGMFARQDELEADPALRDRLLQANFVGTIQFCEAAKTLLLGRGGGRLCVFTSVAGERGRKPIVIYGATKAGLTKYLDGIDARHYADGLRVIAIKPGFVRTTMTEGLKEPPFATDPETAARAVLRAIDRERAETYVPWIWRWVMVAVRALPRAVLRKAEF